jgi:hypothetical protein
MPHPDLQYEKAQKIADKFLAENNYDSFSTPEIMTSVFDLALEKYLNSKEDLALWILGIIACEFEANPSIHLTPENYKTAIYEAIELIYELLHDKKMELDDTVFRLKKFQK